MSSIKNKKTQAGKGTQSYPPPTEPSTETVGTSVTFSKTTFDILEEMKGLPSYRNNRSSVIESLVVNSPAFKEYVLQRLKQRT